MELAVRAMVSNRWNQSGLDPAERVDFNGDGTANLADLTLLSDGYPMSDAGLNDPLCLQPRGESARGRKTAKRESLLPLGLCDFGHQGLMFDKEFGLYYNRRRMYHPTLRIFIQRDPLGYVDGMSLYGYCRSQPHIKVDPFGLQGFVASAPIATDASDYTTLSPPSLLPGRYYELVWLRFQDVLSQPPDARGKRWGAREVSRPGLLSVFVGHATPCGKKWVGRLVKRLDAVLPRSVVVVPTAGVGVAPSGSSYTLSKAESLRLWHHEISHVQAHVMAFKYVAAWHEAMAHQVREVRDTQEAAEDAAEIADVRLQTHARAVERAMERAATAEIDKEELVLLNDGTAQARGQRGPWLIAMIRAAREASQR